jgi:hypothetical protein
MCDSKDNSEKINKDNLSTGGYKPIHEGYKGKVEKGYRPKTERPQGNLPNPPAGGTGESPKKSEE